MTPKPFAEGDLVTVLPPFEGDPVVVFLQPHARVTAILPVLGDAMYLLRLDGAHPPDRIFGPFGAARLFPGWGDRGSYT